MAKITTELLKQLHMNDIVRITRNLSSNNPQTINYRVKEPTEYSLIVQHPVSRDVIPLRWKDYAVEWIITKVEVVNPNTTVKSITEDIQPANNVIKENKEVSEVPPADIQQLTDSSVIKADDKEPISNEPTDENVADKKPFQNTDTKTSTAQLNAIKKYTAKFERINCRFEKGTLEKIRESGYEGSNNQFIVNCVLEKLGQPSIQQPIKKEKAAASKESKVTPLPNKKAFCEGIYNNIIDDIETQEAFTGEPLDVNSIMEIVRTHLTI